MYKRRRVSESLTGGTGDVNPQILSANLTCTAGNSVTTTIPIPIQRLPSGGAGRAQVMEVLKVLFMPTLSNETDASVDVVLSTKNFGTTQANNYDPAVFQRFGYFTKLTTSGLVDAVQPPWFDLTDGAGHGYLVATDFIYAQTTTVTSGSMAVKILYRWKNVNMAEYVGIVQSQQ